MLHSDVQCICVDCLSHSQQYGSLIVVLVQQCICIWGVTKNIGHMNKKGASMFMPVPVPKADRFLNFFYRDSQQ